MIHFLDSSALAKRYILEPGSPDVVMLFRGRKELAASRISMVEVAAALARRCRDGDIPLREARAHARQLRNDLANTRLVEVRPIVVDLASELVWRRSLRAYDSLQLASALHLANATGLAATFWCADRTLVAAAKAEGLRVKHV